MNVNVYLYDQQGTPCNREVPFLRLTPGLQSAKFLKNNTTLNTNQINQLEIGDVFLILDETDKNTFSIGLIAFSNVQRSRIENVSISSTLNDILELNAPDGATVNIFIRNDFRILRNSLSISNILDYERDLLLKLDTKKYRIRLL